jgi:hemolysin activation/secretion protein
MAKCRISAAFQPASYARCNSVLSWHLSVHKTLNFSLVLAVALAWLVLDPAGARSAGGATDPGKLRDRLERPDAAPKTVDEIKGPVERREADPAPKGQVFRLIGADIIGSTVYTAERLGDFYEPYLGREISLKDVETIVEAITEQYRKDGYFLARAIAPPQGVEFGVLRIRVVEGSIVDVKFEGDKPGRTYLFDQWVGRLLAERPIRLKTLERNLLLMADVPGLTVTPALRPIDADNGTYRLSLKLEHRPVDGFVTLDNRGTTTVGPLQVFAGINANAVLGLLERSHLAVFTVPQTPEELLYFEFQQTHILNSDGSQGWFFASRSGVDIGQAGTSTKENSHGTRFTLGLSHPFVRSRDVNFYVNLKLDVFDSDKNSIGDVFDDKLRIVRFGAVFNANDGLGGNNFISTEVSKGVNILGATERNAGLTSRVGGRPDFLKATLDLTRVQKLIKHVQVQLSTAAQWSPHTLLSSEEFAIGGQRFGRAYDPADISGNQGVAGSVELQIAPPFGMPGIESYQFYGFYDLGAVWGTGFTRASMASAGGGIRISFPHKIGASLEVAQPLTRPRTPGEPGFGPRVFFALRAQF